MQSSTSGRRASLRLLFALIAFLVIRGVVLAQIMGGGIQPKAQGKSLDRTPAPPQQPP